MQCIIYDLYADVFRIGIENPSGQYSGSGFRGGGVAAERTDISSSVVLVLQGARSQSTSDPEATKIAQYQIEERQRHSKTRKLSRDRDSHGHYERVQEYAECERYRQQSADVAD